MKNKYSVIEAGKILHSVGAVPLNMREGKNLDWFVDETVATSEGRTLIGKTAQSYLLTEIDGNGNKVLSAPQLITGYEIVEVFQEPKLMVIIGGESIYADTLININ